MICRWCNKRETVTSFNDEPTCRECSDALTNREMFSKLPGVSEAREEYEAPFIRPKDLKLSESKVYQFFNPITMIQKSKDADPNQLNDEYFGI